MRTPPVIRLVAATGLIAAFAACTDAPVAPSPDVQRVEIVGPSTVAPGQTATYSAVERLYDGTTRPASRAEWTSSDPTLIQITQAGMATVQPRTGDATLTVRTPT